MNVLAVTLIVKVTGVTGFTFHVNTFYGTVGWLVCVN